MAVSIIGAGFAGLAAADRLRTAGVDTEVFEARPHWGGHTHSIVVDGFTFDEGPHVSFTSDEAVKEIFAVGAGEVRELEARITNYFRGTWVRHPAQCHLHGLDPGLVTACIVDLVEAQSNPPEVRTYADWCVAKFGRTFAETFPFAYTRKYWTVEAEQLGVDWVGQRVYPPSLDEVVRGALEPAQQGDFHYLTTVRYPAVGGYQSFMAGMLHEEDLRLEKSVTQVDPIAKTLTFADASQATYEHLISTMPLPELIASMRAELVPTPVSDAAERLLCTSVVLVDIAVGRADLFDHEWFYVYDEDISFSRAHFPHLLSAENAPPGTGSMQLEVYHSRHRPLPCPPADLPALAIEELVRMGILRSETEVLWTRFREVPYANVVFDHHRADALATILPWVREHGVVLAGRFGEWGYHWTDDATRSGWRAADELLAGEG